MASYTVSASNRGCYEKSLAADTEDTVTFGRDLGTVEIKVLSGGPVYFTLTNAAATVMGAHTYDAHAGTAVQVEPPTAGNTVVRLISAAASVYSVSEA